MDLDLTIWMIDPTAEYRLNSDKTAIEEWRGGDVQIEEPDQAALDAAWAAYEVALLAPVLLETDKETITGNDVDEAIITLTLRFPRPIYFGLRILDEYYAVTMSPTENVGEQQGTLPITSPSSGAVLVVEAPFVLPNGDTALETLEIEVT